MRPIVIPIRKIFSIYQCMKQRPSVDYRSISSTAACRSGTSWRKGCRGWEISASKLGQSVNWSEYERIHSQIMRVCLFDFIDFYTQFWWEGLTISSVSLHYRSVNFYSRSSQLGDWPSWGRIHSNDFFSFLTRSPLSVLLEGYIRRKRPRPVFVTSLMILTYFGDLEKLWASNPSREGTYFDKLRPIFIFFHEYEEMWKTYRFIFSELWGDIQFYVRIKKGPA